MKEGIQVDGRKASQAKKTGFRAELAPGTLLKRRRLPELCFDEKEEDENKEKIENELSRT
jgi:hypothetical protein